MKFEENAFILSMIAGYVHRNANGAFSALMIKEDEIPDTPLPVLQRSITALNAFMEELENPEEDVIMLIKEEIELYRYFIEEGCLFALCV